MTQQPIITVKNLHKSFNIKQIQPGLNGFVKSFFHTTYKTIVAVDNISFDVQEGEVLAFIGPNGAGKSTTIKMLTGILYPTSGSIRVLGYNPATDRAQLAYHIGSVFGQKSQLLFHLPAIDSFHLFARIYELDMLEYHKRLNFLVEAFEISKYIKTPVRKLSLGQRMKCELVGSLIHKPRILFLDEPTIGLDVIAKQQVRDVIKYLNSEEKTTIFLTSHDAGDIETLTQRTIIINHGSIIFDDSTHRLKKDYLTHKVVELVFQEEADKFAYPDGKIIFRSKHVVRLQVEASARAIEQLLSYTSENFTLMDLTIHDEPLENIISQIYQEKRQ